MDGEQSPAGIQSRIKIILKRVGVCKAQNTIIKKLLATYQHRPQEINKAEDRMQKYLELFKDFQEYLEELEALDKEDQHDSIGIRCETESNYLENIAEYEKLKAIARGETSSDARSISEAVTDSTIIHRRRLKLPESTLPTFNGEYENWMSFKAEFEAMIHNQIDISDVDKFTYLRRATTGPALDKIKVLAITAGNYSRAWALLDKTYSDQRLIISRHINLLFDLPKQDHETASGLSKLVDDTRQHKEMLKSMGVEINEELLVTLLERKLFRTTAYDWDETIEQGIFPKLDDLLEFLSRRAARLINRGSDKIQTTQSQQTYGNRGKKRPYAQAFSIHAERSCRACQGNKHPLFKCESFKNLTPEERIKFVRSGGFCFNCLRDNHRAIDCYAVSNCRSCGERHNTLIHVACMQEKNLRKQTATHQDKTSTSNLEQIQD